MLWGLLHPRPSPPAAEVNQDKVAERFWEDEEDGPVSNLQNKYKDFLEKSPHPHPYHCFEAATVGLTLRASQASKRTLLLLEGPDVGSTIEP